MFDFDLLLRRQKSFRGAAEAASPEPITTAPGYGFRDRVLRTRSGMTPQKSMTQQD
jgi:hypothetical protein